MELKVIICCQIHLCAEGIRCLLDDAEGIKVLGMGSSKDEIKNLMQYSPDIILTDLACSETVLEKLTDRSEKKVLLISDGSDLNNKIIKDMISEGLAGILPVDADGKLLQKAINKLHEGEMWLDRHTIREVLSSKETKKLQINLTNKEVEILNHVCTGLSNKEIANKLFISEQTVKSHCNHLFKKFGVKSRLKLAINAPKYFPESLNRLH